VLNRKVLAFLLRTTHSPNVVPNLQMTFPLLNISAKKWESEDLTDYIVFDKYIYTDKEEIFNKLYRDKLFIDSDGRIYKALKKAELTEKWRIFLRFIPNMWKREILFKSTGEKWTVDELRNFLLNRISKLKTDTQTEDWKAELKKATNHYELIYGEGKTRHNNSYK
jgi:hypothetical protein